jgi:hypothetical protein
VPSIRGTNREMSARVDCNGGRHEQATDIPAAFRHGPGMRLALTAQRSLPLRNPGAIVRRHVIPLTFPELGLIAGTRGMLGAGIALVLADRLDAAQRKAVGRTLLLVGAISTIPLLMQVLHKRR